MIVASDKFTGSGGPPPALFGWIFVIFASVFILIGWTIAALILTAGRFLARRQHYMFCLVMAGVECAFFPFGTVLGVFTIITLTQEPVRQIFNAPTTSAHVT